SSEQILMSGFLKWYEDEFPFSFVLFYFLFFSFIFLSFLVFPFLLSSFSKPNHTGFQEFRVPSLYRLFGNPGAFILPAEGLTVDVVFEDQYMNPIFNAQKFTYLSM